MQGTTCHNKPLRVVDLGMTEADDAAVTQFKEALADNYKYRSSFPRFLCQTPQTHVTAGG